jgi:hypothetical protein
MHPGKNWRFFPGNHAPGANAKMMRRRISVYPARRQAAADRLMVCFIIQVTREEAVFLSPLNKGGTNKKVPEESQQDSFYINYGT